MNVRHLSSSSHLDKLLEILSPSASPLLADCLAHGLHLLPHHVPFWAVNEVESLE